VLLFLGRSTGAGFVAGVEGSGCGYQQGDVVAAYTLKELINHKRHRMDHYVAQRENMIDMLRHSYSPAKRKDDFMRDFDELVAREQAILELLEHLQVMQLLAETKGEA
jgi:type I site-specific restriction endonuclease